MTNDITDTGPLVDAYRESGQRRADLATLQAWSDDLIKRIARAQYKFTHVNCLSGEYDELMAECEEFRAAVHAFRKEQT
jgi:hypothetical protein